MIKVKLTMNLKHLYHELSETEIPYHENMSIDDLLNQMGIDPGAVSIVLVNEELCKENKFLADNDIVVLYPVFSGG